ncbi:HEAT repeat domain-containing protein, partial [Chloroflexota bacterium]
LMLHKVELHPRLETIQYLDFKQPNPRNMPWNKLVNRLQEVQEQYSPNSVRVARNAPQVVKNAVEILDTPNVENRLRGLESLANSRYEKSAELLLDIIKYTIYDDVHLLAATKFAKITGYSDERAIPPLIDHLGEENPDAHNNTIATLIKIGDLAVIPLVNCLRNEDRNIHFNAALVLRKIGDKRTVPALIDCLNDKDSDIRKLAVQILGKLHDERAVLPLIDCLDDKDSSVRYKVITELGKIGDARAVPALINCLEDENPSVRNSAAEALKQINTPGALKALRHGGWILG